MNLRQFSRKDENSGKMEVIFKQISRKQFESARVKEKDNSEKGETEDDHHKAAFTRWKLSRRLCAETWKKEQPSLVTVAVFFHTLETVVEKVAVNSCVCFVFLQLFFQNVKQKIWWWYFNLIIWKQDSVGLAPRVFTPACQQGKDVKSIQAFKIFNLKNKFYHVSL